MPLMSLGMFVFELRSVPYETLSRKRGWRFGRTDRVGAYSAAQFLGPDDETVSLAGMIAPPVAGSYGELDTLEDLASQGDALPLVDAEGNVWGDFTIETVSREQSFFMDNGVPRKTDFTIELKRVS